MELVIDIYPQGHGYTVCQKNIFYVLDQQLTSNSVPICDFKKKWKSLNEGALSLKSQFKCRKTYLLQETEITQKNTPFPKVVKHNCSILHLF